MNDHLDSSNEINDMKEPTENFLHKKKIKRLYSKDFNIESIQKKSKSKMKYN